MERVFAYEHGSPYRVTDKTREKLMAEIDMEEFSEVRLKSRIVFDDLEAFVRDRDIDFARDDDIRDMKARFASDCMNAEIALQSLIDFCRIDPRLPDLASKQFETGEEPLGIDNDMTRDEIEDRLEAIRNRNRMADMAFYAFRDLGRTDPEPFLVAAVQRNPVCIEATRDMTDRDVADALPGLPDESIYDGPHRLAQPDEVWNFGRGDGLEKAILLAAVLHRRHPDAPMTIDIGAGEARLNAGADTYTFPSQKALPAATWELAGS